jgi:hypothetical protein
LISNGSYAKRGFEITLRPHYYKVFVEGSGEALFTKRASPVNAYEDRRSQGSSEYLETKLRN